jgi:2-polyprenyl-3-methyl-5-hydroxy-6-metoxy-1,4-benzoquinol methylase
MNQLSTQNLAIDNFATLLEGLDFLMNSESSAARVQVTTKRVCPLTGTNEARVVAQKDRHGKALRNVCWTQSGFIGVDPIPIADVSEFYKHEYRQQYKGSFTPQKRHVLRAARCARDRYQRIKPHLDTASGGSSPLATLDAGASSGEFVYLMKRLGHAASGIEPHVGYATHAKSHLGLDVSNCTFSEFVYTGRPFQLITLFHVLEHLEFPVDDLSRLGGLLDPNGLFVIEVPNILYRGMKFSHKWHAGHLNGFTAHSLKVTAARAGLEAITCGEIGDGGNLFGVFRQANPLTSEQATTLLKGRGEETLRAIDANSDLDYYTQLSTWTKIPKKLLVQIEERRTAPEHREAKSILEATYKDLT